MTRQIWQHLRFVPVAFACLALLVFFFPFVAVASEATTLLSAEDTSETTTPSEVEFDGLCEGAGELAVFWKKLPARMCSGYQIQVSTSKSFKSRKTVRASAKSYYKRVKGLRGGKKYFARVRAFKKIEGQTIYGAWSSPVQSNKLDKRTSSTLADQKYGWASYKKIRKTGKKFGWDVSNLCRSSGQVNAADSSAEVRLWYVGCTNANYRYSINLSGLVKEVFWADLYDAEGNVVKEFHTQMAPTPFESTLITNLKKGILADLKKYSLRYKKPRLSAETIFVAGGDKVTVSMLNTKKKVKWDFVVGYTLKKETHNEYVRALKKSMKLKRLSNTSVRLSIVKSALPYDTFPTGYYLCAQVGGKKYHVMIKARTE